MSKPYLTSPDVIEKFQKHGFAIVRQFLSADDAFCLKNLAADDGALADFGHERLDATGRKSKLTLWYEPGNDVFGRVSCSNRLLTEMSAFLGGEAQFFHAKLMQKEPKIGGAWEWHQDYGYWYDDGFLSDAMASCYVALDPATRENGCLQFIPGSHKFGRLRHENTGEQIGANLTRVNALKERLGIRYCELEAGDAVYFHSNLLHASGPNLSDQPRWGLISSYFKEGNASILNDARFRKKSIPVVEHGQIFDASPSIQTQKSFLRIN